MKILLILAFALAAAAQVTPPTPAPVPTYSYFAETGITYDYFAHSPASTSGFGVRIGASNVFFVTDVDTTVVASGGQPAAQYATLRGGLEYHLAITGRWEFIALGAIGGSTNGTSTQASFAGGVALSYDVGSLLSRGKFKLPMVGEYRINAITATEVTPVYCIVFRKTF